MSRIIKFRAWDKKAEEMFKVAVLTPTKITVYGLPLTGTRELEDVELMQYIGIKDKNGKEIYEGDFVKGLDSYFEIIWCNSGFKLMEMKSMLTGARDGWIHELLPFCIDNTTNPSIDSLEVIGNIYEKP